MEWYEIIVDYAERREQLFEPGSIKKNESTVFNKGIVTESGSGRCSVGVGAVVVGDRSRK